MRYDSDMALKRSDMNRLDRTWMRYADCFFCGNRSCVNNYDDMKSRTPRMFGHVICPQCDPRTMQSRWMDKPVIRVKERYRTIASVALAEKLAKSECLKKGKKKCKCLPCLARKIHKDD